MPFTGTITVTTSGNAVAFSSGNPSFRAQTISLTNIAGSGAVWFDVTTTSGCSTGYTLSASATQQFRFNGSAGFSAIASTAGGSITVSYLGVR